MDATVWITSSTVIQEGWRIFSEAQAGNYEKAFHHLWRMSEMICVRSFPPESLP